MMQMSLQNQFVILEEQFKSYKFNIKSFFMKKAFTMIELVFVIIVIGILAAVIVPNTKTNPAREAAIQLVSHLRYTQHLAMVDDKYLANTSWYKNRWQLHFSGVGNNLYSLISNDSALYAKDPKNPQDNLQDIKLKGVTVTLHDGCVNATIISFDFMGRPMVGSLSATTTAYESANLLKDECNITLQDGSENVTIKILRETGYISII